MYPHVRGHAPVATPRAEEEKEDLLKEDGVEPLKDKSEDYKGLTLDENIKANVGTEIKIRNYNYVVTEKDVINYYTSEVARKDNCIG